jgi:hypothetical protein
MSGSWDESQDLASVVFSRLIAASPREASEDLWLARQALRSYVAASGLAGNSEAIGLRAYASIGATRRQLSEDWEGLRHTMRASARFDDLIVRTLFPEDCWHALLRVVCDGPGEYAARAEAVLYAYANHRVKPTRARPSGGKPTPNTVRNLRNTFRRIAQTLVDLRALEFPSPMLERWTVVPPISPPTVPPAATDRSAPPFPLLRKTLQDLDGAINRTLGCRDGDEIAAIAACSDRALCGVFRLTRKRAALALLAVVGMRVSALAELRVGDYEPCHRFPDEPGTVGPAIRIRPGKGKHHDLRRWKALGPKDAATVETVVAIGQRVFPYLLSGTGKEVPINPALFPTSMARPDVTVSGATISQMLAGSRYAKQAALLPRHTPDAIVENRSLRYDGYSAHTLRHLAHQNIKHAADEALQQDGRRHVSRDAVAAAVQDHEVNEDILGYNDVKSENGREILARFGILAASRRIWTDLGARREPDRDAIRRKLAQIQTVQLALERTLKQVSQIGVRARTPESVDTADVLALISATNEERQLREELYRAREELRALCDDRAKWRLVPDDEPFEPKPVDLSVIEAELNGGTRHLAPRLASCRDWLTVPEVGTLFYVGDATARRWVNGTLPHRPGHPANPWEADAIPVDSSLGRRRRRLWLRGIKPSALTPEQLEFANELTSRWPRGWSRADREAPLVLGPPFDQQYRGGSQLPPFQAEAALPAPQDGTTASRQAS